ncbi:hypothetical protein Thein_2115 [Thermodesulfatator indicus DSM 15286]|uniref:Outer membrane protein beta-barrel domain-containing protein n=1 Tax=Thermodesulfatator indicus (strain DSM 15286 / JCM 11887 / CIR29812) TaxID=667014 RepID=F8ADE7_THEID|nr:hypothetical protein [Thermodesulfatator indicus]AEH45963.1 hypothetical protein Thein_2115 [Thermodesulfatator indicus DSM 15286]
MKKRILFMLVGLLGVLWVSSLKAAELGLFISDANLLVQGEQEVYTYSGNPVFLGGSLFYSEKHDRDNWLISANLKVKDLYQPKAINLGLGFQATAGKVKPNLSYDVFGIGFLFVGVVNLEHTTSKLPVEIETSLFYAPPILSFADTERIFSWSIGAFYKVNPMASVGVRYDIYDVNIDKPGDPSWDESCLLVGAKIRF